MFEVLADIFVLIFDTLLYGTGKILRWLGSGCRGSLLENFSKSHDALDVVLSVLFWVAVFALFMYFNNKA
jgi:hypothetical protein